MTLTETAALTKKLFVFGVIFVILGGLTWAGINYYLAYQKAHTPIPEAKPDLLFGNLPKPNYPISLIKSSDHTYSLATKTGQVPNLPKILKVYFIPQLSTSLLAPDKAKSLATNFNFNIGPEILSPTEYRFSNANGDQLVIDISSGNFKFDRSIPTNNTDLSIDDGFNSSDKITSDFKSFLSSKNLLKDSLDKGRVNVTYDKVLAKDSSQALISLWQSDVEDGENKFPIVTPAFTEGLVKGTLSKYIDENIKFLSLNYTYWDIDFTKSSTYPLKKVADAYTELQSGSGIIVQDSSNKQIGITSIYLAYFLSEEYNAYLQPVYVFEGDNFVSYIPAIDPNYIAKD